MHAGSTVCTRGVPRGSATTICGSTAVSHAFGKLGLAACCVPGSEMYRDASWILHGSGVRMQCPLAARHAGVSPRTHLLIYIRTHLHTHLVCGPAGVEAAHAAARRPAGELPHPHHHARGRHQPARHQDQAAAAGPQVERCACVGGRRLCALCAALSASDRLQVARLIVLHYDAQQQR